MIITPQANSISVSTANTVYDSPIVLISNDNATPVLVTHHGANTSVVNGTVVVPGSATMVLKKEPTDLLASNTAVSMTKIRIYSM